MISLYRQSWTCLRGNLWFYLSFAAVYVLLGNLPLSSKTLTLWLPLILHSTFVFGLHRHILLGRPVIDAFNTRLEDTTRGPCKFFLLFLGFTGLCVVVLVATFIAFGLQRLSRDSAAGLMTLVALPAYFLLLVLFGTAMPAYVAGDRFGIGATLGRIRATTLPVLGGLLIGPVLLAIVGFAGLVALIATLGETGFQRAMAALQEWPLLPVNWLIQVLLTLASLFATTLAVVVLCNAYRKTAPDRLLAAARDEPGKTV